MELAGLNINDDDSIPVIVTSNMDIKSFVKGYHAYKNLWKPVINEQLSIAMEPTNVADKYAVCVKKSNIIVGHLPLGKSGRFAKTIFYFLRADSYAECNVKITGKAVNLGDGEGMKVPCLLNIVGRKDMLEILKQELCKNSD